MPQEVIQNWFRQHTFVIWLGTLIFVSGGAYFSLQALTTRMDKWEPRVEKIQEHQLLINQLNTRIEALNARQTQSFDRVINKMDDLIDEFGKQNRTVTTAVHVLTTDVAVLKEKHAKD